MTYKAKIKILPLLFIFLLPILLFPIKSFAATRAVPGTYATIQLAVDAASSDDTISVAAGTYNENVDASGKDLTFSGAGADTTTINGGAGLIALQTDSDLTISGFAITSDSGNDGIVIDGASTAVIQNCVFYVSEQCISLNNGASVMAITVDQVTLNASNADAIKVTAVADGTAITVTNSIFSNNGSTGISDSTGASITYTFNNNCMYNNTNGNYDGPTAPSTDVNVNPNFVDADNVDFSLYANSPLIGAGTGGGNIGWYQGSGEAGGNYASEIYVSPDGDDSTGVGTVANPFRSLTTGTNWLQTSGTIYALAGTYNAAGGETFPINVPAGATLTRSGSGIVSIVGDSSAQTITANSGCTISNVTISEGLPGSGGDLRGVIYGTGLAGTTAISNVIVYSTSSPVAHGGMWLDVAAGGTVNVTNCIAYDVSYGFIGLTAGTINFTNCVAYNCTTSATSNALIINQGSGFAAASGTPTVNVKNSIAMNCEYGLGTVAVATATVSSSTYNCIYNNSTENYRTSYASAGTGDISVDPLFVDPDNADFTLQSKTLGRANDSPCIDVGTSTGAPAADIEGTARPQGSEVDMGAYEILDKDGYHSTASKDANKKRATAGDIITYTITITNNTVQDILNAELRDGLPKGFKYLEGTTTLNNVLQADPTGTITRTFTLGTLSANTTYTLRYKLVVGSGVSFGNYTNTATLYSTSNNQLASTVSATVTIVANPLFYNATLIGKVFNDKNQNQIQDNNEEGIPDVELAIETGLRVKTDQYGRYHINDLKPITHIIGLDTKTLPGDSKLTTENPILLTPVTEGVTLKANFGVLLTEDRN